LAVTGLGQVVDQPEGQGSHIAESRIAGRGVGPPACRCASLRNHHVIGLRHGVEDHLNQSGCLKGDQDGWTAIKKDEQRYGILVL
jgi:hypothetical protein